MRIDLPNDYNLRVRPGGRPAKVVLRGRHRGRRHLVPLCQRHHREQHDRGVLTFQTTYRLDLRAEADRIAAALDLQGLP